MRPCAGAIATGTHGTGGRWASLSAQVAGLEVVTADGSVVQARPGGTDEEVALFEAGRVGLGALGIVTAVTFLVEPAFALEAVEEPMTWSQVVDGFDDLVDGAMHAEAYWFPHTDRMLTKRNDRTLDDLAPLPRLRAYVDDELLSNTGSATGSRPSYPVSTGSRRGLCRPAPTPTSPTGCSPRRGGWCSGRWSTRSRGRPACRR